MAGENRRTAQDRHHALGMPEARLPPANLVVEQALLGAVLVNNDTYRKVSGIVEEAHFAEEIHRRIWHVLSGLAAKGHVANPLTLQTFLGDADLGGVTVSQYLARVAAEATTVINAPDYARTVRDLALRRRILGLAQEISDIAYDAPVEESAETIFADLERRLEEMRPAVTGEGVEFIEFGAISSEDIYDAYRRGAGLVGESTGLPALDAALGGLQKTDLIILAGRPAQGKSALAGNIARAVALRLQQRRQEGERTGVVGFFSLEMGAPQIKQRLLSDAADVPFFKLKRGIADQSDMERYVQAERELRALPLMIDATGGLSIAQIKMRARSLQRRRGLELLIVDYLQLLTGTPNRRDPNRVQEVTEITTGLKALAKELDVPILALSQLSRKVEERPDKRPMLSDLRESGSIEQDADSVMFVFREETYIKNEKPREGTEAYADWERRMRRAAGRAEVIIAKNRHGPCATVDLGFEGGFTRFTNTPPEPPEEERVGERRTRKAKITLPREATVSLGVLRTLSITEAVDNTDLQGVPKSARPVPYIRWRDKCAEELLDPGFEEKDAVNLMKTKVVPALLEHELIKRGGTKDTPFAWLTEKGSA